jgi:hypothetical protein
MIDQEMSKEVSALVERYCREERAAKPTSFTTRPLVHWQRSEDDGGWWRSRASSNPGCYVIYKDDGSVMYIGKASLDATIGSRLASHERSKHQKWDRAAYVQMITVDQPFEAPSLEEYLLSRLPTMLNVNRGTLVIQSDAIAS